MTDRRRFWMLLTARECEALLRGGAVRLRRRDLDDLLNGWKTFVRPELLLTADRGRTT